MPCALRQIQLTLLIATLSFTTSCVTSSYNAGVRGSMFSDGSVVVEATADYGAWVVQPDTPILFVAFNSSIGWNITGRGMWIRPIGFELGYMFPVGEAYMPIALIANPVIIDLSENDDPYRSSQQHISLALSTGLFVPMTENQSGLNFRVAPVLLFRDISGSGKSPAVGFSVDLGWRRRIDHDTTKQIH